MKGGNKSQFSAKFGSILTKFKDNSTVQVGHQQVRSILGEFALKDIFTAFVSKMDTIEQMNEREKREISKIYVTFLEVYKTQLLYEQYYEKFMESLGRKTVGVSEAIGHICKTLLNRIQDQEQLYPFVSLIVNIFRNHTEIGKILKQVAETISPNIISSLQFQIIAILQEKMASAKVKSDHLDAVLSLVLSLQQKLQVASNVQGLLLKYLRHEDWSCRKNCVDISYALLVINQSINESIHSIVKQLKYDKIKHVRDSVNNYQKLHQQIFGKEVVQKATVPTNFRQSKIKSQIFALKASKSPAVVTSKQSQSGKEKPSSIDKSIKQKQKNENFFKNAKNSDVIKISEGNASTIEQIKEQEELVSPNLGLSVHLPFLKQEFPQQSEGKTFEAYLKDRQSPKQKGVASFQKMPAVTKESEVKKVLSRLETAKTQKKFNYQNEFQHFKKKSRFQYQSAKEQDYKENISFAQVDYADKNQPQFSLSYISNKNEFNLMDEFKGLLFSFQKRINERLDRMEARIQSLQAVHNKRDQFHIEQSKNFEVMAQSNMQQSPKSTLFNEGQSQSKYQYTQRQGVESNLQEKIRISIAQENWDDAYTIALTNNKKNIFLNLLQRCVFPKDRIVEQCILLQARKLLGYMSTLKWLKYYLLEKEMSHERLQKLRQDLKKRGTSDNRNYQLMRKMLINEIEDKLNA